MCMDKEEVNMLKRMKINLGGWMRQAGAIMGHRPLEWAHRRQLASSHQWQPIWDRCTYKLY